MQIKPRNHPDVKLIVLLIDERPEEVTDMERSVKAEVVASTFDEPAERHSTSRRNGDRKSQRLTEAKLDVVILLDSITRLARARIPLYLILEEIYYLAASMSGAAMEDDF